MSTNQAPFRLSEEAFEELRKIVQEEYGDTLPDEDLQKMGTDLLRLFQVLLPIASKNPKPPLSEKRMLVSTQEFKALKYLDHCIHEEHRQPSVRELAHAVGLRYSRSGFRMLNRLINQGFVFRNENGDINLRENLRLCHDPEAN